MQGRDHHPHTGYAAAQARANPGAAAAATHQQQQQQAALDDLLSGINEWRNIQDVVRLTFKAFHEVLRQQGDSIKALERTLDGKAGRTEVAAALQQKANASEMAARLAELEMVLHKKADLVDMDRRALKTELDASLRTQMADVFTVINTKSEAVETRAWRESSERQLGSLAAEVSRLQQAMDDARAQLHTKAGVMEVGQALSVKADLADLEDRLRDKPSRRQVADALALKADLAGVDLTLGQMRQELSDLNVNVSRRAETGRVEEVSHRLERLRQRVEADSDTTSAALRTVSTAFDEALLTVQQQAAASAEEVVGEVRTAMVELEERVVGRVEESEGFLRELISRKADAVDVERWLEAKCDVEAMAEELEARAGREELVAVEGRVQVLERVRVEVAELRREVEGRKEDAGELRRELASKAEVEDVNAALLDVCGELERRAAHVTVDALAREHALLRSEVAGRGAIGRWLWRSGLTKGGGTVPWNVQAVNTDPANYLWEPDKTVVMALSPGLYKLEVGIYCRHKPIVQVLVEGEVALTLVAASNARSVRHQQQRPAANAAAAALNRLTASEGGGAAGVGAAGVAGSSGRGYGEQGAEGYTTAGVYPGAGLGAEQGGEEGGEGYGEDERLEDGYEGYGDGGAGARFGRGRDQGRSAGGGEAGAQPLGGSGLPVVACASCSEFVSLPARARLALTFHGPAGQGGGGGAGGGGWGSGAGRHRAEGFLSLQRM